VRMVNADERDAEGLAHGRRFKVQGFRFKVQTRKLSFIRKAGRQENYPSGPIPALLPSSLQTSPPETKSPSASHGGAGFGLRRVIKSC